VSVLSDGREMPRLAYSPAEIAAAYGLSRKAIYRAIASGELQAARVCCGSRLLVPAEEARAWVARNLISPEGRRTEARAERRPARRSERTPLRDALEGGRRAA
jgi:excisionase family DNA binding protein